MGLSLAGLWILPEVIETTLCFCVVLKPIVCKSPEYAYRQTYLCNTPSRLEIVMEEINC